MVVNDGLIYYGRMTASISHEINNVLAIVNELAGLQEDLIYAMEDGCEVEPQRFGKVSQDIQQQVQRGKGIVDRLNRMAHSIDDPVSEFDLMMVLEDTVEIAQRLSVMRGVTLRCNPANSAMTVKSNRFVVQQGLFACLEIAYLSLGADSEVGIDCGINETSVDIRMYSDSLFDAEDQEDRLLVLSRLMDIIGGKVERILPGGKKLSLALSFPRYMIELTD